MLVFQKMFTFLSVLFHCLDKYCLVHSILCENKKFIDEMRVMDILDVMSLDDMSVVEMFVIEMSLD